MSSDSPGGEPKAVIAQVGSNGHDGARRGPFRPPQFSIGGPVGSSWREQALARIAEQRALTAWVCTRSPLGDELAEYYERAIDIHLQAAEQAALSKPGLKASITGSAVERTASNLDVVESHLLRLAPPSYVRAQMACTLAHVRRHLDCADPRRVDAELLGKRDGEWNGDEVDVVIGAVHAASSKARREQRQVRSFRNTVMGTTILLFVLAVGVAVVGIIDPSVLPLCFTPTAQVCPVGNVPSGWDVPLVEGLGLIAAALAAAVSLRNVRGTSTPYRVPLALAVLKLPCGALTALLGILLMRGAFVPGLSDLDSSAQILSWAVIFGYSQQLLTQFVDRQAHIVLDGVRGGGTAPTAAMGEPTVAARPQTTNP
jgi:hypothetical protein